MRRLKWLNFAVARKHEFEGLMTRMTLKTKNKVFQSYACMIHYCTYQSCNKWMKSGNK